MHIIKSSIIALIVLFSLLLISSLVTAQENSEELGNEAEINALINGDISAIRVSDWTDVDITIYDSFGIDWPLLEQNVNRIIMEVLWPLNPAFPQPVKRFLGPTSFKLEPEIVTGNENGWFTRINPSTLYDSVKGDSHNVTLEVQVDDSSIDSSVVVGIKVTRIDTMGGEIGYSYIYVPVKAAPTNFIKMETLDESNKEAAPKSMVYFDLEIKNEGYYKDVFEFIIEEKNGLMGLMNQQAVTMEPGEIRRVTLGILTPETLFDPGTPNEVQIYVRSTGDQSKTLIGSLIVVTKGIYISPLFFIITTPIIILIIGGFLFWRYYIDRKENELYGKPKKPWLIPVEKKYLDELKKKNPEKYESVLKMMQDEYQSAMYWFKSYKQYKKQQNNSTQISIFDNIKNILPHISKKEEPNVEKKQVEEIKKERKTEPIRKKKSTIKQEEEISTGPVLAKKESHIDLKKSIDKLSSFFKKDETDSKLNEKMGNVKTKDSSKVTFEEVQKEPDEVEKQSSNYNKSVDLEKEKSELEKLKKLRKIKKAQEKQRRKMSL